MRTSTQTARRASSRKQQQEPTSPWRKLLLHSRSLEGASSDENSDSNHNQKAARRQRQATKTDSKGSASSWGWFLTPPTRLVGNPLHRTNPPVSKRHLFPPSNLTMFLLRLNDNISKYCLLLSDPSLEHCQEAANILDTSIATASPHDGSPASNSSSPSVSPTSFFRKSADQALEGEWDTYSSPLLLLTGAEALYGEMELSRLSYLYNTIQADLRIVKERLCDPWLARSEQPHYQQSVHSTGSTAHQAATSIALVFENLQSFLNSKSKLVDIQTRLFSESSEPFCVKATTILEMCRDMLPEVPREESAVTPMFSSLLKEIKAWVALLEMSGHLEQCQFTATILSARKLKINLAPSSNTVLQSWFTHMLESFVSIMPMYFDRINAFASPLYGFDTMHMWADSKEQSEHYDSLVLDFLRKHESKGGPSMAICIVIDAVSTRNENFERGFVVPSESSSNAPQQLTAAERQRKEWQAVYMRSTVHYNSTHSPHSRSPSHGGGSISTIMRRSKGSSFRNGSRNSVGGEDDFTRSLANIIRPSSQDSSSATHSSQMSVMEYPSVIGPVSWPYTEWSLLVDLVKEALTPTQDDGVQAVTYRQPESPKETAQEPTSTAFGLPPPVPVTPPPPAKPKTDSSFHLVRLSEYIAMVAIVKCEDDGKWHLRRTRGHTDEEIRVFLNEMALKLKVSVVFDEDHSVENVKTNFRQNDPQTQERDLVSAWQQWDESNTTQELLRELKKSFQLRPQSPYMDNLRSRFGKRARTSGRGNRKRDVVDYSESAMAFFLGPDLQI